MLNWLVHVPGEPETSGAVSKNALLRDCEYLILAAGSAIGEGVRVRGAASMRLSLQVGWLHCPIVMPGGLRSHPSALQCGWPVTAATVQVASGGLAARRRRRLLAGGLAWPTGVRVAGQESAGPDALRRGSGPCCRHLATDLRSGLAGSAEKSAQPTRVSARGLTTWSNRCHRPSLGRRPGARRAAIAGAGTGS